MAYKIKASKLFLRDIKVLLPYLEKEWGFVVAVTFQFVLDSKIERLSQMPELGSVTPKYPRIRRFVITKRNKLYYTVRGKTIYLIRLYDTRINPKRNKYE